MRLGVDVGGTFTDLLLHDERTQRTYQAKTPSTPQDQSIGVAAGVKLICDKAGISPSEISLILHGTTVATNAVLEGRGARVGLLVTEGFEYTLHLAKAWTPGPLFGWIVMDKPDPLASLADTRGIPERINARGDVVRPLDLAKATALIEDLCSSGIEALTISLMHAYANPDHERALRDIVAKRFPEIPVSLSSDILPEFREYDRAITTVMNDYVRPIMKRYLSRIEDRLKDEKVKARLHIVRSDGGLMSAAAASERPVHTVLSGPAGGVTSTVMIARRTGFKKLLAFDMGGTSTDVSVILDGEPTISRSTEVGYFPAKVPTLDVRSVGAGGGSIAEVSELTKSLRVGPAQRRRPARPGGLRPGGTEPTVSDANVVLGYLPPVLSRRRHGARCRRRQSGDRQDRTGDGAFDRRSRQGHHRHRQRSDARRAAGDHRAARPRSARFRHRRLRRRRAVACQCAGRTARLLSGAGAAEPGRALGAGLSRSRVQERVRADLHPFDRRPRRPRCLVAFRGAWRKSQGLARRAGGRRRRPQHRLLARPALRAARLSR